jgi:hypothetical protein
MYLQAASCFPFTCIRIQTLPEVKTMPIGHRLLVALPIDCSSPFTAAGSAASANTAGIPPGPANPPFGV